MVQLTVRKYVGEAAPRRSRRESGRAARWTNARSVNHRAGWISPGRYTVNCTFSSKAFAAGAAEPGLLLILAEGLEGNGDDV